MLKLRAAARVAGQSSRLRERLTTIAGDALTGDVDEEVWVLPEIKTNVDREVLLSSLGNMSTLKTVFVGKRKAELDGDDAAVIETLKNSFGLQETADGSNEGLQKMFHALHLSPATMRKNKDLTATASGEIPYGLFDGGNVREEIRIGNDGKLSIVKKTDASTTHYFWTRNVNKLLDVMDPEDSRKPALVAYRDTLELLISNYGWADVSEFDRELKTIISNGATA
jgi:hypothetical protein